MTMITTFAELSKAVAEDWGIQYELSPEEINELNKDLHNVPVQSVIDMFETYYGITGFTEEYIRNMLIDQPSLAIEAYDDAVTDTCVRDQFGNVLLTKIGSDPWPCYGDSEQYANDFYAVLPALLASENLSFCGE